MTQSATTFNAVAHCTTFYYYVQVLRHIADIRVDADTDRALHDFMDFRAKFFTMWNLAAQALLFLLCVVHDAALLLPPSSSIRRAVRSLRDLYFVALAAPMAVTVTVMFWGLFFVDRELVMPAVLDAVVSPWLNHAMHTMVLVLVVAQLLAEQHRAPTLRAAVALSATVSIAYLVTMYHEWAVSGRWIYPVFGVLGWPGRIALSAFTVILNFSQVAMVRALVQARWGSLKADTKTKAIKKH